MTTFRGPSRVIAVAALARAHPRVARASTVLTP